MTGLEQRLALLYLSRHPLEAARAMEVLDTSDLCTALAEVDTGAAHALHLMDPVPLATALESVSIEEAGRLLRLMPIDTQLAVLPLVEASTRERLMRAIDPKDAGLLEQLLSYPRQTAASLVEYDTFRVPSDISAAEVLERSRRADSPVRFYVYVTDRDNRLVGVVSLKQLLRAPAGAMLHDVMHREPARLLATDTVTEVVGHQHWRLFPMLPVVDADELLLGVILYETIQRLREEGFQDSGWSDTRSTLLALSELYWLGMSTALGSPPETHADR